MLAEIDKKLPLDYKLSFQTKECFDLSRLIVFGLNSVYTNYKSLRTSPFWKITFTKKIEDIGYASILKVTKGDATENSHIQRFQEVIPDVDLIVEVCESVKVQFEHFGERFIEEFISTYSGELYSLKYYTDAQVQRGKYLASQLLRAVFYHSRRRCHGYLLKHIGNPPWRYHGCQYLQYDNSEMVH